MTADPFLDQPAHTAPDELEVDLELAGCARVMLALFGLCTVLGGFAALIEVLR